MARRRYNDHEHRLDNRGKAVPLELFFDLVFVFAITQVTGLLAMDPTWSGLGRGLTVLALLWWAWVGYSWLASAVDPEEGWLRLAFFGAMAGMFIVAIAASDVFGASAATFAVAYFVVRFIQIAVFFLVSGGESAFRRAIWSMAPSFTLGPALLVVAAFADGWVRGALWAAALVIDYGGPLLGGAQGWRLSPGHFAERHGLIIIVALGEAIVSVGVGVGSGGDGISAELVVVAITVIAVAAAFWWAYFDVVAIVAEQKLHELAGESRNRLARDSFSYLHLLMVAGIVGVALGAKMIAADPGATVKAVPTAALAGGTALYLITLSLLRWRNIGAPNTQRLVGAAAVVAVVTPLARTVSGMAALVGAAAVCWCLVAYEANRFGDARHEIRHGAH